MGMQHLDVVVLVLGRSNLLRLVVSFASTNPYYQVTLLPCLNLHHETLGQKCTPKLCAYYLAAGKFFNICAGSSYTDDVIPQLMQSFVLAIHISTLRTIPRRYRTIVPHTK
jgi:hypothetical protein